MTPHDMAMITIRIDEFRAAFKKNPDYARRMAWWHRNYIWVFNTAVLAFIAVFITAAMLWFSFESRNLAHDLIFNPESGATTWSAEQVHILNTKFMLNGFFVGMCVMGMTLITNFLYDALTRRFAAVEVALFHNAMEGEES